MPAQTVFDLLMGLPRMQGSLYGAWLLENAPDTGESSGKRSIPFVEWNAQTSMLMDIRNILMGYMAQNKSNDMYVRPPEKNNTVSSPMNEEESFDDYVARVTAEYQQ